MRSKVAILSVVAALLVSGEALAADSFPPAGLQIFQVQAAPASDSVRTDQSIAIRAAITKAQQAGGGVIKLPRGTVWVSLDDSGTAVNVPAGVFLDMQDTVLRLIETARGNYQIILLAGAGQSGLLGGTIIGDRDKHLGTAGEWGMCIGIRGARGVRVSKTKTQDCWGDGIYVGSALTSDKTPAADIVMDGIEARHNRRNNISIVSARNFRISGARLLEARGTLPEAGIDIEPDPGDVVANGVLQDIIAERNGTRGVMIGGGKGEVRDITLERVQARDNGASGYWLESARRLGGKQISSERNGAEGMVMLSITDATLQDYTGLENGTSDPKMKSDLIVARSANVAVDQVSVRIKPGASGRYSAFETQKARGVRVRQLHIDGQRPDLPVRTDADSDGIVGSSPLSGLRK